MLRYKTKTWFSRLVRHLARKRSGSILTMPEPARGAWAQAHTHKYKSLEHPTIKGTE